MKKAVVLISLCCLAAVLLSCGGSNTTIVFVSPSAATVTTGGFVQFTANVAVTWTVAGGGAIDSTGLFKAGSTSATVTITATARDGSGSTGTATVTVGASTSTSTSTAASTPSGIVHRVFVSNKYSGVLNIVNADTDQLSTHTIAVGGAPTFMVQTSDLLGEVVYDSLNKILAFVDNTTETVEAATTSGAVIGAGKISLAGATENAALIPGGTAVYYAVPTTSVAIDANGNSITGAVYRADFTTSGFLSVGIPGARFISMDHNAVHLLAFSQNCDAVTLVTSAAGTLTSNTGKLTGTVLPSGSAPTASCPATTAFSRPVAAVFSTDDTRAYVLSSGPANGGSQAMVTVLDMTQSPPAVLQTLPLTYQNLTGGANVGLLQGTQLYVAGTASAPCSTDATQTCQQGVLTVINTSASPIAITNMVPFGQSAPNLMPGVLTFDGTNLWIGSTGCQVPTAAQIAVNPAAAYGCLALYSPASSQVLATDDLSGALADASDDVTGMVWLQPFNGRDIMYVIEGGKLIVYDNFFDNLTAEQQNSLFITGTVVDAEAAK